MLLSSGAYLPGPDQKGPLPTSGAHVLERDSSEPANRFGMCRQNLLGQIVIHPLCGVDRYRAIRYALNARLRQ
jgi:hypothetical protein